MTKKIRLMDESTISTDAAKVEITDAKHTNAVNELTIKQLMKYLEAIDWKLWEMLKIMKAEHDEELDEADSADDDNLPG
tara:strand:- start:104 stop:340 length:237 start_codon:yes stop_codon:yes gene_type:complete